MFSTSLFPKTTKQSECSKKVCNFLLVSTAIHCFATKWKYKVKRILNSRNSINSRIVIVEVLFIWYPSNILGINMFGLPMALKNDLEFTKVK